MTAGLLNPEHEAVRSNTYKFGERLAQSSSGQGHAHLLDMLSHLGMADRFPHHCAEYYRLLTEVVHTIPAVPAQASPELPVLRAQIIEIYFIGCSCHVDYLEGQRHWELAQRLQLQEMLRQSSSYGLVGLFELP